MSQDRAEDGFAFAKFAKPSAPWGDPEALCGLLGGSSLIFAIYFLSGFASLVFQVAAMKLLSVPLGHSIHASVLTVSCYMAGLGLGSKFAGEKSRARPVPLKTYAQVEILTFLSGWLLPLVLGWMDQDWVLALVQALPGASTAGGYLLWKALPLALVLCIPTFLMGATTPLLVEHLRRLAEVPSRQVSLLYSINAVGATLGSLAAGFVLIPAGGRLQTYATGLWLSLLAGLLAYLCVPDPEEEGAEPVEPNESKAPARVEEASPRTWQGGSLTLRQCLGLAALTGASTMALEQAWIRLFILFYGPSTYSFSAILAVVILGLAAGSFFASLCLRALPPQRAWVPRSLFFYAIAVLGLLPFYDLLPLVYGSTLVVSRASFEVDLLVKFGLAASIVFLPIFFSGVHFAFLLGMRADADEDASGVGSILAANTLASVVGFAAATYGLIPALGMHGTCLLVGAALGLSSFALERESEAPRSRPAILVGLALFGLGVFWPWAERRFCVAFLRTLRPGGGMTLAGVNDYLKEHRTLFHEDGTFSRVEVLERWIESGRVKIPQRLLWINGKPDGSSSLDIRTQTLVSHLPLLIHPAPKRIYQIGLGTGLGAYETLFYPIESLDLVEISPAVVRASPLFLPGGFRLVDQPRFHLHLEDGLSNLERASGGYDVIVSEPTNPWISGVGSLFTHEFLSKVRSKLAPEGVVALWIHTYEFNDFLLASVLKTFQSVFPEGVVIRLQRGDIAFLARRDGPVFPPGFPDDPRREALPEEVLESLRWFSLEDLRILPHLVVGGPSKIREYVETHRGLVNTHDLALFENEAPRTFFFKTQAEFPDQLSPQVSPFLAGLSDSERESVLRGLAISAQFQPTGTDLSPWLEWVKPDSAFSVRFETFRALRAQNRASEAFPFLFQGEPPSPDEAKVVVRMLGYPAAPRADAKLALTFPSPLATQTLRWLGLERHFPSAEGLEGEVRIQAARLALAAGRRDLAARWAMPGTFEALLLQGLEAELGPALGS